MLASLSTISWLWLLECVKCEAAKDKAKDSFQEIILIGTLLVGRILANAGIFSTYSYVHSWNGADGDRKETRFRKYKYRLHEEEQELHLHPLKL